MSREVEAVKHALHDARRSYHDSTRWCEEYPSGDGTGPTFDSVIDDAFSAVAKRIAELEDILDTIHMHGVEREYSWMMVPKTEWDQAFERAALQNAKKR